MKRLITLFTLFAAGCGGDDSVDPIVNMYPFLIQSVPCKGSILMPVETVAIQQGETKGPYYSRAFTDACFIVTTTGPSTIRITTTPSTESSIRFIDPSYQYLNSEFVVDPSVSLPNAVSNLSIQISSTNRYDFSITIN